MSSDTTAHRALLIAHASAVLLGGASLFPRLLALPAEQLVPLRTAVAALLLLIVAWRRRQSWQWLRGATVVELLLLSLLLGGHWWAYFAAIQSGGVGPAVVLVYSAPVITVLLEALLLRRLPTGASLLAGAGVLIGVLLVAWPASSSDQAIAPATLLLGLAAALLYALRNLLLSHRFRAPPGEALAGAQFALVALLGAPALAGGFALEGHAIGWLLLFGSLFTALPHLGVVMALQRLPASTVGLVTSLEVPYAMLFAAVLLGEPLSAPLLAGGACIVASALLASRAGSRPSVSSSA